MKQKRPYRQYDEAFKKDAISLILEQGYFVAQASKSLGIATSLLYKWKIEQTTAPTLDVAVPRVAGAPVAMECKLLEIRPLIDLDGRKINAEIVMGQVVRIHILEDVLIQGQFDITKAGTVARAGYRGDYVHVTETLEVLPADHSQKYG